MAATASAAGLPGAFTKLFLRASNSAKKPTALTNSLRPAQTQIKGHALVERDGSRYAYRLSTKGIQVALLFLFFHKRLCGPLASSRFHHLPDPSHRPQSRLEAA